MFHSEQAQRKRRLVGASLLCSAFLLLAFGLPPTESKPSPKDSGGKGKLLYIEGASDLFANFKARASRSKIHIESKMGGSIWDDKTPEKVLVYNNENKVYFLQDAKAYLTDLNQDFLPIPIEDLDAPTKVQFDGRPARRYLGYAKLGKMGKQCVADFTCLDGFALTPSAHRMWCRFLGLNRGDFGLPVLLTQRRARVVGYDDKTVKLGQPVWCRVLTTTKARDLPLQADSFAVKADWKQAKDKAALFFSKDGSLQAKDIDDFFRSSAK